MLFRQIYHSPIGEITIIASDKALVGVWLADQKYFAEGLPNQTITNQANATTQLVDQWLELYFHKSPPLQLQITYNNTRLTPFRQQVWQTLQTVPWGQTVTYQQLAQQVANKNYTRAVAQAVSHNPFTLIVPCHRVVGQGHQLTGFAGGLERKRWLLNWEQ